MINTKSKDKAEVPKETKKNNKLFYLVIILKNSILLIALYLTYIYNWHPATWNSILLYLMIMPESKLEATFSILNYLIPTHIIERFLYTIFGLFFGYIIYYFRKR